MEEQENTSYTIQSDTITPGKKIQDLEKILEISRELSSSLRLDPLLEKIVETASEITSCEGASILLMDKNTNEFKFNTTTVLNSELLSGRTVPLQHSIAGEVYKSGKPVEVYDVQSDPRFYKEIDKLLGFKTTSLLGVPLSFKSDVIGVLETVNKKTGDRFTDSDITNLLALASHASLAIENARLYESVLVHADDLEDKVRKRVAELQERNQELTAYDRTVAYDLKNPLTVILGYSEMLEMDYSSMSEDEIRNKLRTITELGEKMLSIIDELLFLSGIRDKEVELEILDMGGIIQSAISSLSIIINENNARLSYPDTWPSCMGHAPWVEEVWVNYVSNAIKYGGTPPVVELGAEEHDDGKTEFWVRDNGNGIDLSRKDQLFKNYQKSGENTEKGHGLGLTIVRRIVEKLGGKVTVDSSPGKGSRFSFFLNSYKE